MIDITRFYAMLMTESGCHTYYFAHHTSSTHHTHRTQGYVCATHITTCHKEVIHIARIKTTIRDSIRMNPTMHRCRLEFIIRKTHTVHAIGEVEVDTPSGSKRSILVRHIFVYIVLC